MHFFVGGRACVCQKDQKASAAGLEPATPRSEVWCASDCAMRPSSCHVRRGGIEEKKKVRKREKDGSNEFRTHDLKIMRLTLYLLSYTPSTVVVSIWGKCIEAECVKEEKDPSGS